MSLLQNISNWLLSKKESPKTDKQFFSWNQLSKVLIIAYDNQLSEIVDFVTTCEKENKKVKVLIIYNGKPELAPKPPFEHVLMDKKQFSLFNIVSESFIQSLNAESYNMLIDLGKEDCVKSRSISKLVKASCKIGSFQDPIFDLIIDVDKTNNSHQFLKQVVVYLHMIKTA